MKRSPARTIIPAVVMTAATAVPVVTMVDILSKVASAQPAPSVLSAPIRVSASGASRTVTGPSVSDPFGNVQARVTTAGKRIVGVAITAPMGNSRSAGINSQAIPLLRQETLQAQSANVHLISGATYTSQAYIQSLQGAIGQAKPGAPSSSSAMGANAGPQPAAGAVSGGDD